MKTVLVTGANGQLGKTINDLFADTMDAIRLVFVSKSELDISNLDEVKQIFDNNNFDYCINCAAYTNVELAETDVENAFKVNAKGPLNLAKVCKNKDVVLIHVSTDYVFNGKGKENYTEKDLTAPINQYGKSKLQGELNILDATEKYFIIRTSWLYSKFGKNFVKTIASKIEENAKLQITTSQTGTPTSCEHLAKFMYHIIKSRNEEYGIYHFSAIGRVTWYEFGLQIAKNFPNYDASFISAVDTFESKAARPSFSVLDNSKAQSIYKPIHSWQVGVDEVMQQLINID